MNIANILIKIRMPALISLLLILTLATAACSRTGKNNNTEDPLNPPPTLPATDHTVTQEPETPDAPTPTPVTEPISTDKPTPSEEPQPTEKPAPTKAPAPKPEPIVLEGFISSDEAVYGMTALVQGNYLFYKAGTNEDTEVIAKNLITLKETEIPIEHPYSFSGSFILKGNDFYFHHNKDIYRVGLDGMSKKRLFKGTATILGFYEDDIIALDKKSWTIVRINKDGETKTLVKKAGTHFEAVVLRDGIYYIHKYIKSGEDSPIDKLYYIDFNGNNKIELSSDLHVYDLKSNNDEAFFLTISENPEEIKLCKVKDHKINEIYSISRTDWEAQGFRWQGIHLPHMITLLAANSTHVFYGIESTYSSELFIYSIGIDGSDHKLLNDNFDLKKLSPTAYFSRYSAIDNGYLNIKFDGDNLPNDTLLINLQDNSFILFDGGYYEAVDVEGDYVYYTKSSKYYRGKVDDDDKEYIYGRSKISELINRKISD